MKTKEEILLIVEEIFRDIFSDQSLKISISTTADDIDEWDSLNHINIVMAVEKKFSIKFALGELMELKDVGDMVDLIIEKTK